MARVYGIGWEPGAPYEAYDVHLVRGQKSAPMLASVFLEYDIGWVGAPPPVPSLRADWRHTRGSTWVPDPNIAGSFKFEQGADEVVTAEAQQQMTAYQTFVVDGPDPSEEDMRPAYGSDELLTARLARRSAQALRGLQAHGPKKFAAGIGTAVKTLLGGEAHAIATVAGLAAPDDLIAAAEQRIGFVSNGAAEEILAARLAANRGTLQVFPRLELPQAA
jgi:hypothetical protein